MIVQPLLISYYKHKGMQEIQDSSRKNLIELIVLNKKDVLSHKLDYVRIYSCEFRLNGSLYDIVKELDMDSLVYIYCINDKNEEQLEHEFLKKSEENATNKSQKPNNYDQFNSLLSEAVCYLTLNHLNSSHSEIENYNRMIYIQVWGDIPTPPPRVC